MVFVYYVEYYLDVCPVSEQSFSQVWSDLEQEGEKKTQPIDGSQLKLFLC